jgi:hypothetical protein
MKKLQLLVAAALFCAVVTVIGCKKEGSVQTAPVTDEEAQTISQENAEAEAEYDDITEIGLSTGADLEAVAEANNGQIPNGRIGINIDLFVDLRFKLGPCTTITVEPKDSTFPKTVTIDFGPDGCLCRDGKFRKGTVTLTFTAPIRRPGAVLTIKLDNFYVNRRHIEGTKTITNLTENGMLKYSVQVEGGKVTWPNGRGFSHAGLKVITRISGGDTRTIRDDVYSFEGRAQTSYNNGITVTWNTESPLIKAVACNWVEQGVLKIKINDRVVFIDFGNGDCDNKATLKWNNHEVEITLP